MQRNHSWSRNAVAPATVALVTLMAFACSDVTNVSSPGAVPRQVSTDLAASGAVYTTVWQPAGSRMSFKRAITVPLRISRRSGVSVTSAAGEATIDSNFVRAEQLQLEITAAQFRNTAGPLTAFAAVGADGQSKAQVRGRSVVTKTVDGKAIRLAYAPDDDKASRRPPKALMIWENNKPVAALQFTYAKRGDTWRLIKTRALFLDANGKVVLVSDQDRAALTYGSTLPANGVFGRIGEGSAKALRMIAQAVQPDALYAAAAEEEACAAELRNAAAAAVGLLAAAANMTAADLALAAAYASMNAALASCVASPATCIPAVIAAEIAIGSASAWVTSALAGLTLALALVGETAQALWDCLWPEQQTGPVGGGGGEGGCDGNGGEEWCQWTVWYNGYGDVVAVEEDYCWCQEPMT